MELRWRRVEGGMAPNTMNAAYGTAFSACLMRVFSGSRSPNTAKILAAGGGELGTCEDSRRVLGGRVGWELAAGSETSRIHLATHNSRA